MKKKYTSFVLYLLFFLYFEFVSKILMFNKLPDCKFFYVILFSITASLIAYFFIHLWKERTQKILSFIFVIGLSAFYIFHYLYFALFQVPFSVSTLELASQAIDFYEIGFHLVFTKFIDVLLLLFPFITYVLYHNHFSFEKSKRIHNVFLIFSIVVCHLFCLVTLQFDKKSLYSAYNLYYNIDSLTTSNNVLGILTTQRLSLLRNIFGFEEKLIFENTNDTENNLQEEYNRLDIDFDSLIKEAEDETTRSAYSYLSSKQPTNKNEYTGLYKGKNLIFILAEGFNSIAVSKELTPTLYKLIHEGFHFTNYYSPVFLSTTGGEFQAMTSLIPTQEILGMWRNNSPYLPYTIGSAFKELGYQTQSYHNWSYKYYGRNSTMSTLGFPNYKACGNGLEEKINCKWLPSDIDLINASVDEYIEKTPFVTYYITVSGHAPYNFTGGNSIVLKNEELVKDLEYSDAVKAYVASQLELEQAVKQLIKKLEAKGILDDTVLVLTGDHYPYTLTLDEINEISSYEREETIEVNHSNLIIWNNNTENKTIDKVASQLDVLPTILNLFGIEYDSRLLIGNDIFSNEEGFAIFSNRSWISDQGKFITNTGYIAKNSNLVDNKYIEAMNNRVSNSFTISKAIIEKDLYRKILNR